MAEWLRRWTRNPLGSPRAGSNPADYVELFSLVYIDLTVIPKKGNISHHRFYLLTNCHQKVFFTDEEFNVFTDVLGGIHGRLYLGFFNLVDQLESGLDLEMNGCYFLMIQPRCCK